MMEQTPIREGRTGDKQALLQGERLDLLAITTMPGWTVLLDLMEMECVKAETDLINVAAEEDVKVLAYHKMAKAAWLFFVKVQKKVQHEITEGVVAAELQQPRRPRPDPAPDEILDPTRAQELP